MPAVRSAIELGGVIRRRRKDLGLDQAELARRVGVTRQWVIDIEKGKPRAEVELVIRALQALGLDFGVLDQADAGSAAKRAGGSEAIASVLASLEPHGTPSRPTVLEAFRQRRARSSGGSR